MKYLKVGLLVVVLSLALAGSLLAISDQVQKSSDDASPAAVAATGEACGGGAEGGGCGGGCGGHGGAAAPCAADQIRDAKKALEAAGQLPCPKAAKGEKCDPKTCDDCAAKAAKAEGKPGASCPMQSVANETAAEAPATCPMHAAAAKAPKPAEKPAPVKAHDCKGKDCTACEADCPHKKAAGDDKAVAGKPVSPNHATH